MADITTVKLGGTTYNIKDATALHVGEISENPDYLPITGGRLEGPLDIEGNAEASLLIIDKSLDLDNGISATTYDRVITVTDVNGNEIGWFQVHQSTDNSYGVSYGVSNQTDTQQHQIMLNCSNSGAFSTYIPQAASVRSALGLGAAATIGTTTQVTIDSTSLPTSKAVAEYVDANSKPSTYYATCGTSVDTTAKTVTCTGYTLKTGNRINIRCTTSNTVSAPTININSTGAKSIYVNGAISSTSNPLFWDSGACLDIIYDGTQYQVVDMPISSAELTTLLNEF